ncbi:MAG: V-type ATP synthase subunit F [Ruminococcus sp.]|nr:V-type ATP synthase subunit F [Ruminococcus sp.]
MKFFLISDNVDTITGMRLAGIEGVLVHKPEEAEKALTEAMENSDVSVILMTARLIGMIEEKVNEFKLTRPSPLISEIPDRHAFADVTESISNYVSQAIGIKL